MDLKLEGKRVLVTGSSRGIGLAIATAFLGEGAHVMLTGRDRATLDEARADLARRFPAAKVESFAGDLAKAEVRAALLRRLRPDGLDHLVCNIGSGRSVPVLQEDDAEWRRMLEINLVQAAAMVREFRPLLTGGENPSVIFVGSICGMEALGCPLAYAAAKAGLQALNANLVRPPAADGVRVNLVTPGNVIFPGSTWEDKLRENEAAVRAMLEREVPLNRLGRAEEIADAVLFLASPRAAFITGANLVIDGGQTRGI